MRHWVQEGTETFGGSDKENYLPIYRRNGRKYFSWKGSLGSMGAGKYIDDDGLVHYYDEGGNYYMLEADYLARNDPEPEPEPEPEPKPRRKAVEKDDPFNPKNHTGEIDWSTYKDIYWGESHYSLALDKGRIIAALKEAVYLQCYALDEDIVEGALLHLLLAKTGEEE
jgi:hypothetical protein